jgi:hypothetical protein
MYLVSTTSRRLVYRRIVKHFQLLTGAVQQIQPKNYGRIRVLIRFPVRSHPTLVLPAVGGRSSLGFFALSQLFYRVQKVDVKKCPLQQIVSFRVSRYLNGYLRLLPGFESPLMTLLDLEAFKI